MSLVVIDGLLCCPTDEFQALCCIQGLKQHAITDGAKYRAEQAAKTELGALPRTHYTSSGSSSFSPFSYLPDEWVARKIYKCIQPSTYGSSLVEIGEEDIEGNVWPGPDEDYKGSKEYWTDETGKRHYRGHADMSLTGPASLGGKIVLELCRRLAHEVYKDKAAAQYAQQVLPIESIFQPCVAENE